MENKKFSYSSALNELETILSEIENGEIDIDNLNEKVKRATFLIKECKACLKKTSLEIDKLIEDWEETNKN